MGNTKVRESNIELLRNISMFMILVIHANFVALPKIGYEELTNNTAPSVTRYFIESLGIVAVNVFVFISGWFGINTRTMSVLSFIYQILFFLGGVGVLLILFGYGTFSVRWLLDVFQFTGLDWFIKSYFVLMIIAPILNAFSKTGDEKTQRYVMISFFLFEISFCWAAGGSRFFVSGYGPLHFIGLYVTAQYIHNQLQNTSTPSLLKRLFQLPIWADFCISTFCAIMNTFFVVVGSMCYGIVEPFHALAYAYSNPLVIIGALHLLLLFSKLNMPHIKVVNWLGASSFAVYLFHCETAVRGKFFLPSIQYLYDNYTGVACIGMISLFLFFIYIVSVLIDQLRILTWNKLSKLMIKDTH